MSDDNYYSEVNHGLHEYLELGDYTLQSGTVLNNAILAFKTQGTLNDAKDNAILFPHMWSGTSASMESFVGAGRPLDPDNYFIIFPGQFANGFSSSPSNTPAPQNGGAFPNVTITDDVIAQHRLVTEHFGISELQLVTGWSMGAEQTYEWAVRYPDMVRRAAPFAGTAKTTPHDFLWVRAHENALKSDPAWADGFYSNSTDVAVGLKRHAEVWSVMGLCQAFYKQEVWRTLGFESLDEFIEGFWEAYFAPMDPNNLIWMGWKWRHGDVSLMTGGNLGAALKKITAKTIVVAFGNDMFFPPADVAAEAAMIDGAEYRLIDSLWAHFAMFCMNDEDKAAIDQVFEDLLSR
ncbi:MAG: alpha/beta fold hydrolase [Gammaproteobacteria bacterium]